MARLLQFQGQGQGQSATGGIAGHHNVLRPVTFAQQQLVGGIGVIQRRRIGVLRRQPIVRYPHVHGGTGRQMAGEAAAGIGGSDAIGTPVQIQDCAAGAGGFRRQYLTLQAVLVDLLLEPVTDSLGAGGQGGGQQGAPAALEFHPQ